MRSRPYSHYRGLMALEDRINPDVADELKGLGHKIEVLPGCRFASVEAILHQPKTGFFRSGADPRQPAYAIAI